VPSAFRIVVGGFNRYGRFSANSHFNISDGGCQLSLRAEVEKDSIVALRVIEGRHGRVDSGPVLFQVQRIVPQPGRWGFKASALVPCPAREPAMLRSPRIRVSDE